MKSRRIGFAVLAVSALACSEYENTPGSGIESGDANSARDGAADDGAPPADAPSAIEAAIDAGADVSDPRMDAQVGLDATRDGVTPSEGALPDARTDDVASSDVIGADGVTPDAPSPDVTSDPTAPRFPHTGKYTIVIPPLGDAGAGTSDASTGDAGDAGAGDLADVYYPDPPDLHTASYAFPVVLLFQGAKVARGFYSGVAAGVAGYGFIVVVPDHMSSNIGGPGLYAELGEIAAANAQMKVEAASATAPVRGVVDTMRLALMGHSYGGASGLSGMANMCFPPIPLCTFTRPPELVGGAFYGTNLATPVLGVPALDTGGLPVLLVQGDRDGKALLADGQKTFDQIQKRPKAIINLLGANHYGVTDVDNPAGADPEVNAQTLDHATGVASTGRWIGLFFAAFLNGDTAARGALRSAAALDPNVTITLAE
jgi:dienelactone hydrolase